ncbi:MAG: Gfo/Idh/MocA family oxidoreductase, partial [Hungatella sp.]|nr:Gfo/Idh/MocA family oxidoreductase [Hungatella sp.]
MNKLRLGIIGNGYLGGIIAGAWRDGLLPEYELVGIVGRTKEKTDALAKEVCCSTCSGIDELLELKPDYIAEAASGASVKEMAEKILSNGCNLIVLSIGAFADKEFYEKVKATAVKHNTRVHIASGAVGGFDVLRTVSLMGEATAGIETRKGPESLRNTPLFEEHLMTDEES